jgi:hypothetical protein
LQRPGYFSLSGTMPTLLKIAVLNFSWPNFFLETDTRENWNTQNNHKITIQRNYLLRYRSYVTAFQNVQRTSSAQYDRFKQFNRCGVLLIRTASKRRKTTCKEE